MRSGGPGLGTYHINFLVDHLCLATGREIYNSARTEKRPNNWGPILRIPCTNIQYNNTNIEKLITKLVQYIIVTQKTSFKQGIPAYDP